MPLSRTLRRAGSCRALAVLAILACPLTAACAEAPMLPSSVYVGGGIGAGRWMATGNEDELEAGSEPGLALTLEAGQRHAHGRWGIELSTRRNNIHGVNGDAVRGADGTCIFRATPAGACKSSADGNTLYVHSLQAITTLEPFAWRGLRPYALVGAGFSLLHAVPSDSAESQVDDIGLTPSGQLGLGLAYRLAERVDLDLGYRLFLTRRTRIDGLKTEYNTHGPHLALQIALAPRRSK